MPRCLVIRVQPALAWLELRLRRDADHIERNHFLVLVPDREALTVQQRGVRIEYLSDLEGVHVDVERMIDERADRFVLYRPFLGDVERLDLQRLALFKLFAVDWLLSLPSARTRRFEHQGALMV